MRKEVGGLAHVGAKPRRLRRPRNRYYKSVMHAAVQYSDLAMLMWEGGSNSHSTSLPGSKQVCHGPKSHGPRLQRPPRYCSATADMQVDIILSPVVRLL